MNTTLNINLSAAKPTSDYTSVYGPYFIKGTTPVVFNLFQIAEEVDPIMHVTGNFGDGVTYEDALDIHNTIETAGAIEIAQSGKIMSVSQNINHTYVKQTSSFSTSLTAIFVMHYTSSYVGIHKILFNLAKDSYYNSVRQVNILTTQIMPTSSHDIFALASDANGNVFNLYLSKDELPVQQINDDTTSISGKVFATRNGLPITTRIFQYAIVPRLST
jgi:hypothetical protein